MSIRLEPFLTCNRLVKETWEDREYELHLKRLKDIKKRKTKLEDIRFPHILNNQKKAQIDKELQEELVRNMDIIEKKINRIKLNDNLDHWNLDYDKRRAALKLNHEVNRNRVKSELEIENERLAKRIKNTKGVYDVRKWDKEFEDHQNYVRFAERKFYTPRGMGHRKLKSLPDIKKERLKKDKNAIKMLNEAVNKLERGDVVLMKTLVKLNYYERMETKNKYEEAYDTDLKKGLVKVLDKSYEPLINALLTDKDQVDVDKLYESLYDPNEACIVIVEALLIRNLEEKNDLINAFHKKIDSELSTEIENKLEGELKIFLLDFIKNDNLHSGKFEEKRCESDARELSKELVSFTSNLFLNIIRSSSKKHLKHMFKRYQEINGSDICSEVDSNKPVCKSVKLIQNYVNNPIQYHVEKLQKNFKTNKNEFLRLLAIYPHKELKDIIAFYNKKYQTNLQDEIINNYPKEVAGLILKMIHKTSDDDFD